MSYVIPDEILDLYAELSEAFSQLVAMGDIDKSNMASNQLAAIAMCQLDKALAERGES